MPAAGAGLHVQLTLDIAASPGADEGPEPRAVGAHASGEVAAGAFLVAGVEAVEAERLAAAGLLDVSGCLFVGAVRARGGCLGGAGHEQGGGEGEDQEGGGLHRHIR